MSLLSTNKDSASPAIESAEANDEVIGLAFRGSLIAFVVICILGGTGAYFYFRKPAPAPLDEKQFTLPTRRTLPKVSVPEMPFADVTATAGIDFVHENGAAGDKLLPETMGSGCAFFDFDNDGDQDLLLVNSNRWPGDTRPETKPATSALYQNDGSGKFTNVTVGSGLDVSLYGMGVAVADYDADGNVDVFLTAVGRNRLFRNIGGRFFDVTDAAGVAGEQSDWGTSCGWLDYDNDGDLDLFVCHYVEWNKQHDLAQDFRIVGVGRAYGRPQQFGGAFPSLYRNNGDGTFADVSADSGVKVTNTNTQVPAAKSLGVAFADFDADGRLDILVANDTVPNFLFHNAGNGTFQEIGSRSGIAFDSNGLARGAMGIDIARFRNNSDCGIAIGNFANEMSALYVSQKNQLQFRDDAVSNGLGPATRLELTFGLFFFDADLDGRLDLFAANGHLEDQINRVQKTQFYAQPPHFFWNCGPEHDTEFLPVTQEKCGKALLDPMVGRGAAYADMDGDGDLDLLVTASGGPARLFRNDQPTKHHWLRLHLIGKAPNRDAIGATVEVVAGGISQYRLVSPTRSYLSQCELPVTFGLGDAATIDKVVIRWPSGQTRELTDIAIDKLHHIEE
jgi:hypothetical protein